MKQRRERKYSTKMASISDEPSAGNTGDTQGGKYTEQTIQQTTMEGHEEKGGEFGGGMAEANDVSDDYFDGRRKRKRKQKDLVKLLGEPNLSDLTDEDDIYTYDELLSRLYTSMGERVHDENRLVVPVPMVLRYPGRSVAVANITEVAEKIKRPVKHMISFILSECGCCGSVNGKNWLVIRGRFRPKAVESVVKAYVRIYVICRSCRSTNTSLTKEGRVHFMVCGSCSAKNCVPAIQSGFRAVVDPRRQTCQN